MDNNQEPKTFEKKPATWMGAIWWSKLIVAVIAVPAIGLVIGSVVPGGDLSKTIAFVLTCWICVYFGMKLMANNPSDS